MIDYIRHRVNGEYKAFSEMTDEEIEYVMDEYDFREVVGWIKYLATVAREQNHIIIGLEHLLHEDMSKEDYKQ